MSVLKCCLAALALIFPATASSQTFAVRNTSLKLHDPARGNRKIAVDVFYPLQSKTDRPDKASDPPRFPLICFGHGFVLKTENYSRLIDSIVAEGFIVAFPESESGWFPSHMAQALDLKFVLEQLPETAKDKSSPLYGIIGSSRCLLGHSMGGGAAFLAAAEGAGINAIAAISPYNTKPSAAEAAKKVLAPTLIFSGSEDCITPSDKHQLPIYNGSGSDNKTFILIKGGTHCPLGSEKSRCVRGERISGCRNILAHEKQLEVVLRYLVPWLKSELQSDSVSSALFGGHLQNDPDISFISSGQAAR